jgi:chromate reductase
MFGAVWAQAELRKVLAAMGSRVTGKETPIGQVADKIDADGRVTDNTARAAIRENLLALAAEVELNRAAA